VQPLAQFPDRSFVPRNGAPAISEVELQNIGVTADSILLVIDSERSSAQRPLSTLRPHHRGNRLMFPAKFLRKMPLMLRLFL
jgi:hypothetical protein